jgi:hypothetical protein
MKHRIASDSAITFEIYARHICHFGITEGLAALAGGADLASLFGFGATEAAPVVAGATDAGIAGTGTGLFGGATGLAGTALAGGAGTDIAALTATPGLGAFGTAADFLAAPTAIGGVSTAGGFGAAADAAAGSAANTGLASGLGGIDSLSGLSAPTGGITPSVAAASPVSPTGGAISSPSLTPAAAGTSVAPTGAGPTDLTSITGTGTGLPGGATGVQGTNLATGGTLADPTTAAASGGSPTAGSGASSGAAANGGAASSSGFSFDNLVSNATKSITNNPLSLAGPLVGAGGLAYNLLQSKKELPNETNLENAAATATGNANQLSSYLLNGNLPPGLQTAVSKATQDAKTAAISNAAKNGQPTDPSQNSTLAAELASIDQQSTITTATVGQQLLQTGLSEAQLASTDFATLVNADLQQQQMIGNAIGNFAKSLGGLGSSGLKLNVGSSGTTVST